MGKGVSEMTPRQQAGDRKVKDRTVVLFFTLCRKEFGRHSSLQ